METEFLNHDLGKTSQTIKAVRNFDESNQIEEIDLDEEPPITAAPAA